jgi:tRNA(Ile)-lysidine synthase
VNPVYTVRALRTSFGAPSLKKTMHPLLKKTLDFISRERLIAPEETVVVGVSAGADSMALLWGLAALRPELPLTLVAAYADHGLRPEETRQEASLVEQAAAELGIACRIGALDVKGEARRQKISIEHAARLLRYHFFEEVAEEVRAARIAVAHTADDQAEEVLIRLLRGSGRAGLAGMKTLRDGRIIRPFLAATKAEILAYLREKQISWLEDSSNRERIYLRNRVRLDLLPHLAANFNPNIRSTLTRTAAILQDEEELLAALARRAGERVLARTRVADRPAIQLLLAPFRQEARAMQRRLVETACLEMGHSPAFREIEQLLHLAAAERRGARLHLRSGLRVHQRQDHLLFFFPQGRGACRGDLTAEVDPAFSLEIHGPGLYTLPGLTSELRIEHLAEVPAAPELHRQEADYLDADRLSFPLRIRSPQAGDAFQPLGAPGTRKIGDFLTDRKVPREQRWQIPVVVAADNSIVALLGLRIGQKVRITGDTRRVLRFSLV